MPPEFVYCQYAQCYKPEEVREGRTRMMRCSACHHTTYCSHECQKADWKAHKVSCKAFQKTLATLKDMANNFASDYDQWKASTTFTLTYLGTSVLYDGDLIFTHYMLLDVDYRPNANSPFEKFFIKKDSLRVLPCDDAPATLKAHMENFRRNHGVKERIALIVFSCSGGTLQGHEVVRMSPMGCGPDRPQKKADACKLIDLINAGAHGELENFLYRTMLTTRVPGRTNDTVGYLKYLKNSDIAFLDTFC